MASRRLNSDRFFTRDYTRGLHRGGRTGSTTTMSRCCSGTARSWRPADARANAFVPWADGGRGSPSSRHLARLLLLRSPGTFGFRAPTVAPWAAGNCAVVGHG